MKMNPYNKTYVLNKLSKALVVIELDQNNKLSVIIETKNLRLESVKVEDYQAFYDELYSDPDVMKTYGVGKVQDLDYVKKGVQSWAKKWENNNPFSAYKVIKDGKIVGFISLTNGNGVPGEAEIAGMGSKKFSSKGYGIEASKAFLDYTECLSELGYEINGGKFTTLFATARTDNFASMILIEKYFKMTKAGQAIKFGYPRNFYYKKIDGSEINQDKSISSKL